MSREDNKKRKAAKLHTFFFFLLSHSPLSLPLTWVRADATGWKKVLSAAAAVVAGVEVGEFMVEKEGERESGR